MTVENGKLTSDVIVSPSYAVAHFSNAVDATVVTTASIASIVVEGTRMDAVTVAIAATRVDVAIVVTAVMEKKEGAAIAATEMTGICAVWIGQLDDGRLYDFCTCR
jgi:hypothetical protein